MLAERLLQNLLSGARNSKRGVALIIVGVLILFSLLVFGFVSVAGNVLLMLAGTNPVIDFLGTGGGVLVAVGAAIFLILLGVGFMIFLASDSPQADPAPADADGAMVSQPTTVNTDAHQAQQVEIETYRSEVASLEAQRTRLQDKIHAYDGDRAKLKTLLNDAHAEGTSLRGRKPDWEAADEWATAVSRLVRDAFGDQAVKVIMDDSEDRLAADREATREQAWLDNRLHRLHRLRQTLGDRDTVPFRSGFDPHEWKDWKSPPDSKEPEQPREELREAEQEREELREENKELIAKADPHQAPQTETERQETEQEQRDEAPKQLGTNELHERFYAQSLVTIDGATFNKQPVPLDGFRYERCTFEDCTFVYRGEKPFSLTEFVIKGDNDVDAPAPGLTEFVKLLALLKYINPEVETDMKLTREVAYGYRFAEDTDLGKFSKEELKAQCLELAEKLHQFYEDHALGEADRAEMIDADFGLDVARADTETMSRFRKGPKKEVMGLLAEMKQRGWWNQEDFDLSDWEAVEGLEHPRDLRLVANRLERIGYNR